MDADQFRDHLLGWLAEWFPGRHFNATASPLTIATADAELGLGNLYADYIRESLTEASLEKHAFEHFTRILAELDQRSDTKPHPWDEVCGSLRLQLMPAAYRQTVPIVTFPFLSDVNVGIVIDSEVGYAYVRDEDVKAWAQSPLDVYEEALANLEKASSGIAMTFIPPPTALIGIETKDGYDAARILMPAMREFALEKLGEPFFAGIPNRDFLIMWSTKNPADFQGLSRAKIASDFADQSHPLTATILLVSRDSISPAD
jgi:uncharacterized protein YtpQ (UPF0354 family)